jgi:hypothetical protein
METKVITGKVRFSYAHVHEPKAIQEGQEPKYSVSILIDKSDKVTLGKIEAAIDAAMEEGKAKFGGKIPKNLKLPLRDGDEEREDDENYAGKMFVNAASKTKPGIVGPDREAIMSNDEFYSGCYGRASLNFYAYDVQSKGIACGLNNLQKLEDGPRLSGGSSAEDDFAEDDDLLG